MRNVFHVTLPALLFLAVANASLTRDSIFLPAIGFSVDLACLGIAYLYTRSINMANRDAGALLLGANLAKSLIVGMFSTVLPLWLSPIILRTVS